MREFFEETRHPIQVISGFRTDRKQRDLGRRGRPAAPINISTHTSCPATGMDLRIVGIPVRVEKHILGRIAVFNGLRWGGGSPINPETLLPSDWNHFDLGPRRPSL